MLSSRKVHAVLTALDLISAITFSFLFILLDARTRNKLNHALLMFSILIFPMFIISYHVIMNMSLHEAELNLRMYDFNWNRRECGEFTCERFNRCNLNVTIDHCIAYEKAEKVYSAFRTLNKWLPKDFIIPLSLLFIMATLQRARIIGFSGNKTRAGNIFLIITILTMSLLPLVPIFLSEKIDASADYCREIASTHRRQNL